MWCYEIDAAVPSPPPEKMRTPTMFHILPLVFLFTLRKGNMVAAWR